MSDYVPGRLLVAGFPRSDDAPWLVELGQALSELGLAFRLTPSSVRRIRRLRSTRGRALELLDAMWVSTAVLEPAAGSGDTWPSSRANPQAWWVIERLRTMRPALAERLSLAEVRRPTRNTPGSAELPPEISRMSSRVPGVLPEVTGEGPEVTGGAPEMAGGLRAAAGGEPRVTRWARGPSVQRAARRR